MRELIKTITFLLLVSSCAYGQENSKKENKLKLKSVNVGFGVYSTDLRDDVDYFDSDQAGLTFSAGLSVGYKKHIFSLDIDLGIVIELNIFGEDDGKNSNFNSYEMLYGREFTVFRWFRVEVHTGLGLFLYTDRLVSDNFRYETREVLGVPVDLRLMFDLYKGFSVGINPEVNFNSVSTTYSGNIVFQYRFN